MSTGYKQLVVDDEEEHGSDKIHHLTTVEPSVHQTEPVLEEVPEDDDDTEGNAVFLRSMSESTGLLKHFRLDRAHPLVRKDHNRMVTKFRGRSKTNWFNHANATSRPDDPIIPPERHMIISNVVAGILCGIKLSIGMVVFSSLQWGQCPKLAKHLGTGVKMNYLTATVMMIVYARKGGIPCGMVLCQDIPSLLLGKMSIELCQHVPEEYLVHNFIVVVALQTICSGLLFYVSGKYKLTSLAQSVPTSVVGGFVASCGFGLWKAALHKITDVQWAHHGFWPRVEWEWAHDHFFPDWPPKIPEWQKLLEPRRYWLFVAGMVMAVALKEGPAYMRNHTKHNLLKSLASPIFTFAPVVLFYLVIWKMGISSDEARELAWLPDKGDAASQHFSPPWTYWHYWGEIVHRAWHRDFIVHWDSIAKLLPQILVCAILSFLELVFNVSGIDSIMVDRAVDLQQEAQSMGLANIVSGFLGGNMGYLQGSMTLAAKQIDQATHKLSIYVAGVFSAFLFLSGIPAHEIMPAFVSSAFFLVTGWFFIKKWVIESWYVLRRNDFWKVIQIVVVSIVLDIKWAMLWGLIVNLMSFNFRSLAASRVKCIDRADRLHSERTLHMRPIPEVKHLTYVGYRIMIIRCCGFLYWGDATNIVRVIMDGIVNAEVLVSHLIIDFTFVIEMDLSAVKAFDKCFRAVKFQEDMWNQHASGTGGKIMRKRICFAGADKNIQEFLSDSSIAKGYKGVGFQGLDDEAEGDPVKSVTPPRHFQSGGQFLAESFDTLDEALEAYENDLLKDATLTPKEEEPKEEDFAVANVASQGVFTAPADLANKLKTLSSEVTSKFAELEAELSNSFNMNAGISVYNKGDDIIRPGEHPEILVIVSGTVSQVHLASDSAPRIYGANTILGAVDFALQRPFQSTVVAEELTHVLHVGDRVIRLLRERDLATYVKFQDFIMGILRAEAQSHAYQ